MIRRIVVTKLQATEAGHEVDTYFDRVVKYVPTEVVGAWIAIKGVVESSASLYKENILWGCFAAGAILAALWTWKQTTVPGKSTAMSQIFISTGAFIVWAFALGEPFTALLGKSEQALYGSLALIFFTLVTGLVVPRDR